MILPTWRVWYRATFGRQLLPVESDCTRRGILFKAVWRLGQTEKNGSWLRVWDCRLWLLLLFRKARCSPWCSAIRTAPMCIKVSYLRVSKVLLARRRHSINKVITSATTDDRSRSGWGMPRHAYGYTYGFGTFGAAWLTGMALERPPIATALTRTVLALSRQDEQAPSLSSMHSPTPHTLVPDGLIIGQSSTTAY